MGHQDFTDAQVGRGQKRLGSADLVDHEVRKGRDRMISLLASARVWQMKGSRRDLGL